MMISSPAQCDLLVTSDWVVTQDASRRVIENGAVAITGGVVVGVGTKESLASCRAKNTLRLDHSLLMPGLVNAHTHVPMTFFRGLADDLPLMDWLTNYIFPREAHLTEEIVELGALLGCAEMIRTGTTAFSDMYLLEDSVACAVDAAGVRSLIGGVVFTPADMGAMDAVYDRLRDQARRYEQHSRIRASIAPHSIYTTTPDLLVACRDLAKELKLPLHIHLSETQTEVDICLERYGKRPIQYCHDLGLLTPTTMIAHGVVLEDDELDILAQTKTRVAHNPRSNMKLASGVARIPEMLRRDIPVALGTDGAASNNALNMFAEMSACALLQKVHNMDATACPAGAVLDMATRGGALALDWRGLGEISVGACADMVALDLTSPNMLPMYHPESHIVYAASGHEVCMTMVEGKVLYQDGEFLTIDYPSLIKETEKLKHWVKNIG